MTGSLLDSPPENAQFVAKEKELDFAIAITVQPQHDQADNETQAAIDASKDQGRPGW